MDSTRITDRDWLPEIHPIREMEHLPDLIEKNVQAVYWGEATGGRPDDTFSRDEEEVALVVGPEGGFTDQEKDTLDRVGGQPVSLGPRNFRSETSSLCLTVLWLSRTNRLPPQETEPEP